MARPKLDIDPLKVEHLAQLGCKTKEIADHFKCDPDTITGRFSEELAKGRADLRMSLRRWQLEAAKKGNVVMLIWLGKQMLDQTETVEQLAGSEAKPIVLTPEQIKELVLAVRKGET